MASRRANSHGASFERKVCKLLDKYGYRYECHKLIGKSIYGSRLYCDVFVTDSHEGNFVLECKWQSSKGSVDEKFPFTIANIFASGIHTVLVIDGGGASRSAVKWAKSQVSRNLMGVMSFRELEAFVKDGGLDVE